MLSNTFEGANLNSGIPQTVISNGIQFHFYCKVGYPITLDEEYKRKSINWINGVAKDIVRTGDARFTRIKLIGAKDINYLVLYSAK